MKNKVVGVAALLAGMSGLVYEMVWTRYLYLILGSNIYAVGVVTACYMVGLAAGSFVMGRLIDKKERFATIIIFGGFGVLCLMSPVIYGVVNRFSGMLEGNIMWTRVAISFASLFLPTFLIGGTIPAAVKRYGNSAGLVYAMNTIGSVIGAAASGFVLIKYLGLSGSGVIAGLLSIFAGALLLVSKKDDKAGQINIKSERLKQKYEKRIKLAVVIAYGFSGFTAMAFQMYITKILTLFFMDSVYDFAIIVSVFLTGLSLGNLLSSRLANRNVNHVFCFSISQLLVGIITILGLYLVSRMPYLTDGITNSLWPEQVALKVLYSAMLLILPTVLWGSAFPLVSRICLQEHEDTGKITGSITGWNTVGSALGSILGSFLLTGLLGIRNAIILNGAINLAVGVLLYLALQKKNYRRIYATLIIVAIPGTVFCPKWDRFEMSTSFLKPGQDVEGNIEIEYYNEDANGITSVVTFLPYDQKYLTTNRLYTQNTSDLNGAEDHRRLGYLPMLIHSSPEDVLVAGLGAGITLRGVAEFGNASIDCVEISNSVVEAASYFAEENDNVLDNDNVTVIIDDARHYVSSCTQQYDVIIADIFFPMSSGSSNLFSREYYEECKSLLKENGLMAQWLPLHQLSQEELEIIISTYTGVFEHTYLWFGLLGESIPVVGLIGMEEDMELSFSQLEELYSSDSKIVEELENTALDDEYMFLSHFIAKVDQNDLDDRINTDDKPLLEFINPMVEITYSERGTSNLLNLLSLKTSIAPYVQDMDEDKQVVLDQYDIEIEEFILSFIISYENET